MKRLRYIKDLIAANKYRYILGVFFLLIVDTLQLVLPKILGTVTDNLQEGKLTFAILARFTIIIVLIAVGIAVFRFFWRYLILGVSRHMEETLRNRFYEHLQKLSISYYNNHKTGDLMAHATNDMHNVTMATGFGVTISVDTFIIPVVSLIMMFSTAGFGLTVASFSPLLLLALTVVLFQKVLEVRIQKQQESFSILTETARENFSGIRVVKAFVQEMKEIAKFEKINSYNRQTNLKFVVVMSMLFPTIMSISALSFVIALWYGGISVINGNISMGDFVAFNGYLGMLIWPVAALGWVVNIFQRGSVSLGRINTIMDEQPEISDSPDAAPIGHIKGTIEFRNLSFTYPDTGREVLKDISVTIEEGKTLAIVGRTGSGKTTMANLLPRLLSVPEGTLFIDGTDINRIPLSELRSSIGYVPQDTFLFSASVKDNIDFFSGADDTSIENAAKSAMVYDNIMEFPEKFSTIVGERGVTLSGGQKQRIAIARTLLNLPSILILDDCLSAVDTSTEEHILKNLKEAMKNRTSIIISHRVSSIKDADEIIMLDEGRIIERGTHESLLAMEGAYYELYRKQLLAEQLEEAE